jgi:hypothetical protein
MNAREEEMVAKALLANPDAALQCFHQKRWAELAGLVRFVRRDIPVELAQTDPALYRTLRDQVTRFFLRGGDALCLEKLESLASCKERVEERGSV